MNTYPIYYSKKKTLMNIILMFVGILAGIFLILNNNVFFGFVITIGSLAMLLYEYIPKFKKDSPLIEFSDKGILTVDEFINWDFIKTISLKTNDDFENPYLQLVIEYTDKESLEEYKIEKKETESDNYYFDKEEFDNSQRLSRKINEELGIKTTYFEYYETEEEAEKIFDKSSNEIIKPEAEIYYAYKTVDFEFVDKNKNEIKNIIRIFEKKTNRNLP